MVRSRTSCEARARSLSVKARLARACGSVARACAEASRTAAVDREQRIALLDDLAVLEMHLVEVAGDARANLHRVDRDEAPDIFVVIGDLLGLRARRPYRRRRGAACFGAPSPHPASAAANVSTGNANRGRDTSRHHFHRWPLRVFRLAAHHIHGGRVSGNRSRVRGGITAFRARNGTPYLRTNPKSTP
jgi:hypothetical protein